MDTMKGKYYSSPSQVLSLSLWMMCANLPYLTTAKEFKTQSKKEKAIKKKRLKSATGYGHRRHSHKEFGIEMHQVLICQLKNSQLQK